MPNTGDSGDTPRVELFRFGTDDRKNVISGAIVNDVMQLSLLPQKATFDLGTFRFQVRAHLYRAHMHMYMHCTLTRTHLRMHLHVRTHITLTAQKMSHIYVYFLFQIHFLILTCYYVISIHFRLAVGITALWCMCAIASRPRMRRYVQLARFLRIISRSLFTSSKNKFF